MKKIPAQIKKEIVRKVLYENKSVTQLSREHNVSRKAIYSWIKRYKDESASKADAFKPQYVKGKEHPKARYHETEKKLLKLVADNPKFTVKQLTTKVPVSSWTVWKILDQNNLNKKVQRLQFAESYDSKKLTAEEKREAVHRFVEEKESVTQIAKELDVARKTVYSWIKRYEEDKDNGLKTFSPRYVKGVDHHNTKATESLEKQLLDTVTRNPELSINKLANNLPVSAWTVWKLLDKHNLNSQKQREYYALQTASGLEKKVPFTLILDSFGYVAKELELLMSLSRKIPKTVEVQLITPFKSFISTLVLNASNSISLYINSVSIYLRNVIRNASFALDQLVNDVGRFTFSLSRFTATRSRYSYYYATFVLMIILSVGFADRIIEFIPEEKVVQVSQRLAEVTKSRIDVERKDEEEEMKSVEKLVSGDYVVTGETDYDIAGTPKFKVAKVASLIETSEDGVLGTRDEKEFIKPNIQITDPSGSNFEEYEIKETDDNGFEVILADVSKLKPGQYVLGVSDESGTDISQEFSWGILAINTNKNTYNTNENIEFSMSVLDSKGVPKCDADLALVLRNVGSDRHTLLTTADNDIQVSEECDLKQKTNESDYNITVTDLATGKYEIELIASLDGINHKIASDFEVVEESKIPDFEVSRAAPIKVASGEDYPVVIRIKANRDYSGVVIDQLPANFLVKPFGKNALELESELESEVNNEFDVKVIDRGQQLLSWDVDFKEGETYSLTYAFSDLGSDWTNYYLGPVEINGEEVDKVWEFRQDPSVPVGRITKDMRYGRVRVEEKMLKIQGKRVKTFMEKAHVKGGETPKIKLEEFNLSDSGNENTGWFQRLLGVSRENVEESQIDSGIKIEVIDIDGNTEYTKLIEQIVDSIDIPPENLKPGKHFVTITDIETGDFVEQAFLYGVLALNLNKSTYSEGESAYVQMASLDDSGQTVCDSNLELTILDPAGASETFSMQEGTISVSDECLLNNVTDEPDYSINYPLETNGEYNLILTNLENGYSVDGKFLVEDSPQYLIERVGATRINPYRSKYVMTFYVETKENFSGELVEVVPDGFEISESDEFTVSNHKLVWDLDLSAGEEESFVYEYQAPKVSPELYLLGEAKLIEGGNEVFAENRQWQLASDATIYLTSGTSWQVPSDWNDNDNSIEVVGGGGGGDNGASGANGTAGGGAGGGGGYAIASNIDLTPDDYVTYQVGQGGTVGNPGTDTYFNGGSCGASDACATGGGAGSGTGGGSGGSASVGTGYSGGDGGDGGAESLNAGGGAGGGGGAAGLNAAGSVGSDGSAGSGNSGGAGGAGGQGDGSSGGSAGAAGAAGGGTGGNGGDGTEWDSTHGSGGGSGGGGGADRNGSAGSAGTAGIYGAGGGGGGGQAKGGTGPGNGSVGRNGLIVVDYTPPPNSAPTITVDEPDGVSDEIAEGANFTVQYDLDDTDDTVTANFYYDTNATGLDGVVISGCASQAEGTDQTCTWDTTGVTPGTYYVYGTVSDGTNPQQNDYSSGVVTINDAPTITVDQPDGVSDEIAEGANFTVQYDLDDTDDIVTAEFYYDTNATGLDGVAISGCASQGEGTDQTCTWDTSGVSPGTYYVYGIVDDGVNSQVDDYSSGVVTINDPPEITVDEPDGVSDEIAEGANFTVQYDLSDTDDTVTADFYYDTNATGLDGVVISGCQNEIEGTNLTCTWDTTGVSPGTYYVYGIVDDGVNSQVDDYSADVVTINDIPAITVDEPDGVSDEILEGAYFTVQYDLADAEETVTADFYYDNNSSGLDGVAISGCQDQAEGTDQTCTWDTTGVTPGTYYVYGITNDGLNPQQDDYSSGVVTINDAPAINVDEPDGVFDEIAEGANYTVQYDLSDTDDVVTADFYYDDNSSGLDGVAISGCQNEIEGINLTCIWDTSGVTPGTYYVYGIVDDGTNPQQDDYSAGVVTINDAPTINVDEPDGTGDTIGDGENFTVQYDLADTDDTVTADFYYDTNATGLDGVAISGCQNEAEGTDQTCIWDTTGVTPGTYYVYGIVDDGTNPQVDDYSSGVVTITDTPDITVDEPDGVGDEVTEGDNFTVQYDLADTDDVVTADFYYDDNSSGLDGTSISGCQNQAEGTDQTCTWDTTGVTPGTYYVYGIVDDGENPQQDDYSSGVVTITSGSNDPPTINVDEPDGVSDEILVNANFTVQYDLDDTDDIVTADFYYDTDSSGLDGVAISGCQNEAEGTNQTCTWDTTGVGAGTYFVYGIVDDGTNPAVDDYSSGVVTINDAPTINVDEPDGVSDEIAEGANFTVQYDLSDTVDVVTADFYYDTNNTGLDGTSISGCQNQAEGTNQTCSWDTTGVTPGTYYVYGIVDDGFNPQQDDYSSGVVTINDAPEVNVDEPDGVSDEILEGANFTVQYDLSDTDDTVTADFYYDTNATGLDGTLIAGCQTQAEGTNQTCTWDTTGVTPGTYFVYGIVDDGVNAQVDDYSAGVVTINDAPDITVDEPDGVSDEIVEGANFTVQYDLSDTDDVVTADFYYDTDNSGLDGVAISGCSNQGEGINQTCSWDTTGVTPGTYYVYGLSSDGTNPQQDDYSSGVVTINDAPTINVDEPDGVSDEIAEGANFTVQYDLSDTDDVVTADFYYDTNDTGLDGTSISGCQNQAEGTDQTCTWDTTGVSPGTYYVYGIVDDGVNPQVDDYSSGVVTINDPPTITVDQPDGVSDEIAEGANSTVQYDLDDTDDTVTADFYYDTNDTGLDGVAISGCQNEAEGTDLTCTWDTTGVTPGTYYVYGIVDDGVNAQVDSYSAGVVTINDPPTITVDEPDGVGDSVTEGDNYNVQYDLDDTDDTVTADFYYDTNNSGLDGVAISGCASQGEGTDLTCTWDTTGVTPGTYYVYGIVDDGVNPAVNDYSPGMLTVNVAPTSYEIFITSGTSWQVPEDWDDDSSTIEVIGGGGGGDNGAAGPGAGGGGGGGGGYSSVTGLDLTPLEYVTVSVGTFGSAGNPGTDTYFGASSCGTSDVCATGGGGGTGTSGGSGGVASVGTGYSGGIGGAGGSAANGGGGGGGGAGAGGSSDNGNPGSAGSNASGNNGGASGAGGQGDGTAGGSEGSSAAAGENGGNGGNGTEWDATHGSGGGPGGGGGANRNESAGNAGTSGQYGAGGGGGGGGSTGGTGPGNGSSGRNGIIVVSYTESTNLPPQINVDEPDGVSDEVEEDGIYTVQYDLSDSDSVATASFYYDTDSSGLDGVAITGCADQAEGSDQTCNWDTTGVSPGTYYVYGIADDDEAAPQSDYSSGVVTINNIPTVTNVSLNGGSDIDLSSDTTTNISFTATVTDADGYEDILSATGSAYRSGVSGSQDCSADDNNCYYDSSCALSGCAGNSCTATCTVSIEFYADATDTGGYSAQYWLGWIRGVDDFGSSGESFSPTDTTDMNSLLTIDTTSPISYGAVYPDSSSSEQTVTITNTGNRTLDLQVSGADMCTDYPTCSGAQITVGNQEYSLTTFSYGSGTDLTTSPTPVDIDIVKSTVSPSNSTDDVYWRIGIPPTALPAAYTGVDTVVSTVSP